MSERPAATSFLGLRHAAAKAGDFSLGFWSGRGRRKVKRHAHDDAHFIFMISGELLTGATRTTSAFRTQLVYYPAQTFHEDQMVGGIGAFVSISVGAELTLGEGRRALPVNASLLGDAKVQIAARSIAHALATGSAHGACDLEALSLELTAHLWDGRDDDHVTPWLSRACEALSDPFAAQPSIAALSRTLGVHPVHLTRSFRRAYGMTPAAYAKAVRLSAAAQLMTERSHNIAAVAALCGFADHAHLTNSFKRAYGVSPSFVRKHTAPRG